MSLLGEGIYQMAEDTTRGGRRNDLLIRAFMIQLLKINLQRENNQTLGSSLKRT
jgi:hypothetical protein